jgi:hypothetical protein
MNVCYYWLVNRKIYQSNISKLLANLISHDDAISLVWDYCVFRSIFEVFAFMSHPLRVLLLETQFHVRWPITKVYQDRDR